MKTTKLIAAALAAMITTAPVCAKSVMITAPDGNKPPPSVMTPEWQNTYEHYRAQVEAKQLYDDTDVAGWLKYLVYLSAKYSHASSIDELKKTTLWGVVREFVIQHDGCRDPGDIMQRLPEAPPKPVVGRHLMFMFLHHMAGMSRAQEYFECSYTTKTCERGGRWFVQGQWWRIFALISDDDRTTVLAHGACASGARSWVCWNFTEGTYTGELNREHVSGDMDPDFYSWPFPRW